MKKILLIIIYVLAIFTMFLTACVDENIVVNVENTEELNNTIFGRQALVHIGDGLYYDSTTLNVYWWNGYITKNAWATTPTPYLGPNGLVYKYDPETNTFKETTLNYQE